MIKEYFWVAIIGILLNATLILMGVAGFLPLNIFYFGLIFLIIFLLALYRPIWVFWLFVISLPLESVIISSNQIPISFRLFQMIGIMLFLATSILLILKVKNKNLPTMVKLKLNDFLILILIGLSFIPLFLGNSLNFFSTLKLNLVLLSFGMIYFLARFYFQEKQIKLEALWFFIATSLPILIFGVYQAVAFKLNWVDLQVFAERSNGTFTEPDWFGFYLVFLGALVYWVKLYLFRTENETMIGVFEIRKIGQWFLNFYLLLIILVLLLTVARSAWLGFAGVSMVYFFFLFFQKKIFNLRNFLRVSFLKEFLIISWVGFLAIFLVIVIGLSNFNLFDRATSSISGLQEITVSCEKNSSVPKEISSLDILAQYNCQHINLEEIESEMASGFEVKKVFQPDPNIEIRKDIYGIISKEIKNHFVVGQGLGSSAEILGEDNYGNGFNSSNIFLEIWFSLGTIGLLIFGWVFLIPILIAFKNIINKSKLNSGIDFLIILTGIALLIPNLFNAGIFLVIFWVWLAVVSK